MWRTILVSILIIGSVSLGAQTPEDPATEAARLHREATEWRVSGAVTAVGGIVFEVLGQTSLATERTFCTASFNTATCQTLKDPNMGAVYGGAIMAGVGIAMIVVGGLKESRARKLAPSISVAPGRVWVGKQIAF